MTVEWNKFWCRVLFKEFIKHFRKLNDEQIVHDIRKSMDDLEDMVSDSDTFGSQMVRWSLERAEEPFATAARENGKKGGRPRKNQETTADTSTREGEDERDHRGNTGILESSSSANHYGVAPHREAGDVSANDSNPITLDSRTGKDGQPNRRTDGHSLRVGNVARPPVRSSGPMPGKDAVRDFALENGLDEVDAYNCWYATVNERGGCDSEGKKVSDWKAYVVAWCRTASKHRKERNA